MELNSRKLSAIIYLHYHRKSIKERKLKRLYRILIDDVAKWNKCCLKPTIKEMKVAAATPITSSDRRIVLMLLEMRLAMIDKRRIRGFKKDVYYVLGLVEDGVDLFLADLAEFEAERSNSKETSK